MFLEDTQIDLPYSVDAITREWSIHGIADQSVRLFVGDTLASPSTVFQIVDDPNHAQAEAGSQFERLADDAFSWSISHNLRISEEIRQFGTISYYEPQFSGHSHGFRPKRGCQTALTEIYNIWKGTKWFIEGDIKGCFDNIDHHILMNTLRENIRDNRFLRLIEGALKAGYCEEWIYHPSLSGSPQGGIVSPILSNIYMDRLDRFVENTLIPAYTQGKNRASPPAYGHVANQLQTARRQGNLERVRALQKALRKHPSKTQDDPGYRRLRYIRYADDFLCGFAGPLEESHQMKEKG